jgi:hypothetical protein
MTKAKTGGGYVSPEAEVLQSKEAMRREAKLVVALAQAIAEECGYNTESCLLTAGMIIGGRRANPNRYNGF